MIEKSIIDGLVANPSENLNVEVKRWIDPTQPTGEEKIVKGTFALRNRNGGFFVIGFDDGTLTPDLAGEPSNAKDLFHVDVIQELSRNTPPIYLRSKLLGASATVSNTQSSWCPPASKFQSQRSAI